MKDDLLLLIRIAGYYVGIPAAEVQSVIELDQIYPVPQAPPHIIGLSAMRSRALTVIDCKRALGLSEEAASPDEIEAASEIDLTANIPADAHSPVIEIGGHLYALKVDTVEEVIPALSDLTTIRGGFGAAWKQAARGMVETSRGPTLIIDIHTLIDGQYP